LLLGDREPRLIVQLPIASRNNAGVW
jgi:hypothetical protein